MYITQPGLCQRDLWKGQAFVSCSDARLIDNSQTSLPGALFPVVDPAPLTLFVLSFSPPITSIFVVVIPVDCTTLRILLCFGSCVVTTRKPLFLRTVVWSTINMTSDVPSPLPGRVPPTPVDPTGHPPFDIDKVIGFRYRQGHRLHESTSAALHQDQRRTPRQLHFSKPLRIAENRPRVNNAIGNSGDTSDEDRSGTVHC